jgi:hypothetical protein
MAVAAEFHGLILSSHGTLSDNEKSEILEFIEAREFALALETFCGFLLDANRRVTPDLYIRIHSLCQQLDGVDPYIVASVKAAVIDPD